jgi:AcrR family transcriptional regulator
VGSPTDVRSRRRAQTREEILAAAWELAERRGIAGVSLRDLAAEVGMQAPSLYTYFDSKAAIYDAMFAAGYGELDAVAGAIDVDPSQPVETLEVAIATFLDFCQASVPRYQLMFTRAVPDWEPSPEAYAVSVASFARTTEQLVQLGIDQPHHIDLFTGVTSGLAAQQLANDPGGGRWRRLSRDAAEMLLAHVRRR